MPMLFARYRVGDIPSWRIAFEGNAEVRRQHGLSVRGIYRDATYANGVIVVYEAENLDRAHDFYHSDEQRARMRESGLARPPEFWMANEFSADES